MLLLSGGIMAQKKALRYNLTVGEKYGLKQEQVQDIEQSVSGMVHNIKNTFAGDVMVTINSKTDDVYTSEIVFESMLFKMESAMANMTFDSKEEALDMTNPLNKTFSLIVGHPFQMKFDVYGNVIEVKGFANVTDKIVAAFSDNPQQGELMKKALSSQFSDENMKNSLGLMLLVYPKEKLKKGANWSHSAKVVQPIPIHNSFSYKVESVGKDVVEISGTGLLSTPENASNEENGMTQHFDLNGKLTMTASIDTKTGWPSEVNMNQAIEGHVAIESAQMASPMEVPMKIKVDSKTIAL